MRLELPPPPGFTERVIWTGSSFLVGDDAHRVLNYEAQPAGWAEELTATYLDDNGGEDHYINVASRQNAIGALERWLAVAAPRVIDIGCASGYMLRDLRRRFPRATVIGADSFSGALNRTGAAIPDIPLVQFDLTKCPLPDQFVDAVIALNVLEHIEDDERALGQICRILRPGGIACIEVPAGPRLYDIYDRELRHFRRYTIRDLTCKAKRAGLDILHRSHLGFFAFPAFWLVKKRNRKYGRLSLEEQRAIVLRNINSSANLPMMRHVMAVEGGLRRLVYLPFGIRCVIVCRRP